MFHFVTQYQHPQRLISRSEFNLWRFNKLKDNAINIYEAGGDWVTIPTIPYYKAKIVDASVWKEIQALLYQPSENTLSSYDFIYHATSSDALPEIFKQRAILSAEEQQKRGKRPITGAFSVEASNKDDIGRSGVYAGTHVDLLPYAPLRWFDEYTVYFKINPTKVREYIKQNNIKTTIWNHGNDPETGSGIMLGPIIPLSCVDSVYCWKKYQTSLEQTTGATELHIHTHSLEATVVYEEDGQELRKLRYSVKDIPQLTNDLELEDLRLQRKYFKQSDRNKD